MAAVATGSIDANGILAAVGGRAVECYFAALVAVICVYWPGGLVPTALEVVGDLSEGEGEKGESQKGGLVKHDCDGKY